MSIKNLKGLIANKVALIDINNKNCHDAGEQPTVTRINHELKGVQQALRLMGFDLKLDLNPYYYEDGKPSTFTMEMLANE